MYRKNSVRTTYKTNRRSGYKKSGGYQNFKGRNKSNVTQQYNKYLKLAKEASRSGDRIQSEYYYQFTDHYYRQLIELGINIDENNLFDDSKIAASENNINSSPDDVDEESKTSHENLESIESIPFIAEPTKEKRTRSTK